MWTNIAYFQFICLSLKATNIERAEHETLVERKMSRERKKPVYIQQIPLFRACILYRLYVWFGSNIVSHNVYFIPILFFYRHRAELLLTVELFRSIACHLFHVVVVVFLFFSLCFMFSDANERNWHIKWKRHL